MKHRHKTSHYVWKLSSVLHHSGSNEPCPLGEEKSLQGSSRWHAFIFCQGPVSSAFPSNLKPCGRWRKDPHYRAAAIGLLSPAWLLRARNHLLLFSSASPHCNQSSENTLGTWTQSWKGSEKAVELILSSLRTPPLIYPNGIFLPSKLRDNETQEDLHSTFPEEIEYTLKYSGTIQMQI